MRIKSTIGGVQMELEANTQAELETILEAMVNVTRRMEMFFPHRVQFGREQKTAPEAELVSGSPPQPMAVGGDTPPQIEQSPQVRESLYANAKTIAARAEIALVELGKAFGTGRYYSYSEILRQLKMTGGDDIFRDTKDPIQAIRQAIRNNKERFVRDTIAGTVGLPTWETALGPLYPQQDQP